MSNNFNEYNCWDEWDEVDYGDTWDEYDNYTEWDEDDSPDHSDCYGYGVYSECRVEDSIVVPKKWTNNTGGYYNNITVQFVMEVS